MNPPLESAVANRPTALRRLLLRASSPWTALILLGLVFAHQAIGSAGYLVRQAFEQNEMQWFNGWVSLVLWLSLCACQITASVIRIPWRWAYAGTHLSHLSVVLLVGFCVVYFGGKFEGEALLMRHYVAVETGDGARLLLLPNPGYASQDAAHRVDAKVEAVLPRWTIRSGAGADDDKNAKPVWATMVSLGFGDEPRFNATLIEGRPDLTQFTLQGRTPTSYLPEYANVVAEADQLHALDPAGKKVLSVALTANAKAVDGERSLAITEITPDWPLLAEGFAGQKGTQVSWTLRAASGQTSGSSIVGQPTLTRFLSARVKKSPSAKLKSLTLIDAPESTGYHSDRPALYVRPLNAPESHERAPMRVLPTYLEIHGLPRYHDYGNHVADGKPLAIELGSVGQVAYAITGFSPYADLDTRLVDDPTAPLNPTLDVVFDAGNNKDRIPKLISPSAGPEAIDSSPMTWQRCASNEEMIAVRERLEKRFPKVEAEKHPGLDHEAIAATRMVFMTGPDNAAVLWVGEPGRNLERILITIGEPAEVELGDARFSIVVRGILDHPKRLNQPVPIPRAEQQSRMSVGQTFSYIQVRATPASGEPTSAWVPFTPFPHLPEQLGQQAGTLSAYQPRPVRIHLPAGDVELLFSREPIALPGPMWMTGFEVPRRPGSDDPSEFFCTVGYGPLRAGGGAVQEDSIHMNHPLEWDGTFFFQAGWDPPLQALTVLGVGNRPAGGLMLASSILLAIGMAWASLARILARAPGAAGAKP